MQSTEFLDKSALVLQISTNEAEELRAELKNQRAQYRELLVKYNTLVDENKRLQEVVIQELKKRSKESQN